MRTATRGMTLVLLGAVLVQFPVAGTATGYEPRERTLTNSAAGPEQGGGSEGVQPGSGSAREGAAGKIGGGGQELPVARTWEDVVRQVKETSPGADKLRMSTAEQAPELMRCFRLEDEKYCLGLGFVDQTPSKTEISQTVAAAEQETTGNRTTGTGAEQTEGRRAAEGERSDADPTAEGEGRGGEGSPTGALAPSGYVAERAALPRDARVTAELEELRTAWEGREKARELRMFSAESAPETEGDRAGTEEPGPSTPRPVHPPTQVPSTPPGTPTPSQPTTPPGTPETPEAPRVPPSKVLIMDKYRTSQERGYWCGPATFQSIDWADDKQRDTQASWAKDLGTTRSGTAISAMVKQTNLKTGWDAAAGTYIVQSVGHWNTKKFFAIHQKHLGDGSPAPIIEHTQLLKRYFPYLAFNHSGHFQVGRGYDRTKNTIAIFEVFNERRFNSRGNVTHGPKNIPASALFNATLANKFKNIGL